MKLTTTEKERDVMNEVGRYIIDTTGEHLTLHGLLTSVYVGGDVNIAYNTILDSVLNLAYKSSIGEVYELTLKDLVQDLLETYFGLNIDQMFIEDFYDILLKIFNYYLTSLFKIAIGHPRILYLRNIDKNGIIISEYNIGHLIDKEIR